MPSASQEVSDEMVRLFGDPIDDSGPMKFLRSHGFVLGHDWYWSKPGETWKSITHDEYVCILFLVQEWDFGSFRENANVLKESTK